MSTYEEMHLDVSEGVGRLMEARGIRQEDVQEVIHHAETTGEKFINPSSGRSLASFRPDRVTSGWNTARQAMGFKSTAPIPTGWR